MSCIAVGELQAKEVGKKKKKKTGKASLLVKVHTKWQFLQLFFFCGHTPGCIGYTTPEHQQLLFCLLNHLVKQRTLEELV